MDQAKVGDAGTDKLFHDPEDLGFIENGQKLFGVDFNGGKKAGGPTPAGKDGFGDVFAGHSR